MARKVWEHFAQILGKPNHVHTVQQLVRTWLHNVKVKSVMATSVQIIIFGGMWEIWKSRCRHRFENVEINYQNILNRIYVLLNNIRHKERTERQTNWDNLTL